jgi:hypothetical protein
VILEEDAKKIRKCRAYNILPMEEDGVLNPFTYFPEVATLVVSIFLQDLCLHGDRNEPGWWTCS